MRTSYGGPRPVRAHHPGGRKGGPDDGPSQRARPRTQGEEALGGGRRTPEGGESPSLGRAEGILAPEPPERGGRGEGPAQEGAPSVSTGRPVVESGIEERARLGAKASETGAG